MPKISKNLKIIITIVMMMKNLPTRLQKFVQNYSKFKQCDIDRHRMRNLAMK